VSRARVRARRPRGFNLPELMIALALGLFLLAAFLTVVAHCRDQFTTNESFAHLQDTARSALAALTDDIEHAGFYGFSNAAAPRLVRGSATLAAAESLRQGDAATPVAGLPAGAHDCGVNYAVDLSRPIEGSNDVFGVGPISYEPHGETEQPVGLRQHLSFERSPGVRGVARCGLCHHRMNHRPTVDYSGRCWVPDGVASGSTKSRSPVMSLTVRSG